MGRLTTSIAAAGVDAGNLPEKLPNISFFDALLPASLSKSKKSQASQTRSPSQRKPHMSPSLLPHPSKHPSTRTCSLLSLSPLSPPNLAPQPPTMPFSIQPLFRKPFKLIALDADTNQPLDPDVRRRTRVTYYELQNGSNGSKKLVAHKGSSQVGAAKPQVEVKAEEAKPDGNKTGGGANAKEKKADAPAAEKKPAADANAAWTPEGDAKLKALKGEGKTWRQIGEEMGRGKAALTARWREIGAAGGNAGGNDQGKKDEGGKGGEGKTDGGAKSGEGKNQEATQEGQGKQGKKNKGGKGDGGSQEGEMKKEQSVAKNEAVKAPQANNEETRFTMGDWLVLQEDDLFSFGELQCLSELIAKDCDQSWQRISANFFDLTGRRIHPNDVREKFETMALMAEGRK